MAVLTVSALRDMLANLDPNMPVRMGMNWEYEHNVNAVYVSGGVSGGNTLMFDNVTADLGPADGDTVLFNARY